MISSKLKTYFLIINLLISIIAFTSFVHAADCSDGTCGDSVTPDETNTGKTPDSITGDEVDPESSGGEGIGGTAIDDNDKGPDVGTDTGTGGGTITNVVVGVNWQGIVSKASIFAGVGGTLGALAGGDNGEMWGSISGAVGGAVAGLLEPQLGTVGALAVGAGVGGLIFILTYVKSSIEVVEFQCLPWQAPIGGEDCELCQEFEGCSEYTCKSLGQACAIINPGTEEQKCIWQNPHDVNSPLISFKEVNKDLIYKPDNNIRPPATGVVINHKSQECIKAFTPLKFRFETSEPAQCKVDYNLTKGFEEMSYYVSGNSLFDYNHTEELSLPGPDALNVIAPELKNDGSYTLFIRCQDANGNYNQDAYSVSFCVEKGPDTTPPKIVNINIPSGNPVLYDQINLDLEVYVNEPSECKWDREDTDYENMDNNMDCDKNVWEMNNENVYTCRANLTGMENRKENKYYFRCKDQPWKEEGDRNTNAQSYLYTVSGTQPLNIISITPFDEKISGATDVIPIFLEVKTDNGYENGESLCYYHISEPVYEQDYILFSETKSNVHTQRQDLAQGEYTYYIKCVDLGGNTVYNTTTFTIETDRNPPLVIRTYKESGQLKIITTEESECTYSTKDCNFEIEQGISMTTFDSKSHTSEWITNQNYFIRCKDEFENQPYPNTCSIVLRAADLREDTGVIIL